MCFVSPTRCILNLRNQRNCLFLVFVARFFRFIFVELKQLAVAKIFLNNNAGVSIDRINLRHWNLTIEKEPRDVEIRVKLRIESFRIDRSHSSSFVPADTIVLACRCVGSEWDNLLTDDSLLGNESRESIGCRGFKYVGNHRFRSTHCWCFGQWPGLYHKGTTKFSP